MTLRPGARLGPYEIRSWLGAGGMGEVYLATDTRLGRTIAIKILPASLAGTSTRRLRWDRETRVVSSLNHPHICALFDVGDYHGLPFIVMEHLQGETLSRQLARGPLSVGDAVRHAREIADALSHAHRAGIIHRDLKPANIMMTASGAKLLDFGLAALQAPDAADVTAGNPPASPPTETITEDGAILGTVNYMAPEQLEARPIDARADIFALGAVLYEMLTGQRAFDGGSKAGTIAAILDREPPPLSAVRRERVAGNGPPPTLLQSIVTRCLAKNVEERWQTAHDLHAALSLSLEADASGSRPSAGAVRWWRRVSVGWTAVLLAGAAAVALTVPWSLDRRHVPNVRFLVPPPDELTFNQSNAFMSLSPDGRTLAFSAVTAPGSPALWIRPLDSTTARQLPGTDGAVLPFWSADSRSLAFTSGDTLKTIEVATGRVRSIAPGAMVGTWNAENVILIRKQFVGPDGPTLWHVPAGGGELTRATTAALRASAPEFLPDGRHFLFSGVPKDAPPGQPVTVYAGSLDSLDATPLFESDSAALYAWPGYVLYMRGYTLVAQPFDATRLRPSGDPVPIVAQVDRLVGPGRAAFSVSQTGVLAYRLTPQTELVWFDRKGTPLGTIGPPAHYANPALSPDGGRLAVQRVDPSSARSSIWIINLATGEETRFASESTDAGTPLWSADGREIVYRDSGAFYRGTVEAQTRHERLIAGLTRQATPLGWTQPQGALLFDDMSPPSLLDLHLLSLGASGRRAPMLRDLHNESQGQLSPDGRWLAYVSNESGRNEVYVRSFPDGDVKRQVTSQGGLEPRWRPDGSELYYLASDRSLMAVGITTIPSFDAERTVRLFQTRMSTFQNGWFTRNQYVVARDGRVLVNQPLEGGAAITVETNWTARLSRR